MNSRNTSRNTARCCSIHVGDEVEEGRDGRGGLKVDVSVPPGQSEWLLFASPASSTRTTWTRKQSPSFSPLLSPLQRIGCALVNDRGNHQTSPCPQWQTLCRPSTFLCHRERPPLPLNSLVRASRNLSSATTQTTSLPTDQKTKWRLHQLPTSHRQRQRRRTMQPPSTSSLPPWPSPPWSNQ